MSTPFATDTRRRLQLGLAALWLFDGLLQMQTFMFSKQFGSDELTGAASGNPPLLAHSITAMARFVSANPVALNALFAAIQLALGLGIALRVTVKPALAASIAWSLLVWWFGEGLGGLLAGGANPMNGAPGGVILYALVAVLLWPSASPHPPFVAARPVGATAAKVIWVVLWGGLAALTLQPAYLAGGGLRSTYAGMADGQPGWVQAIATGFASLTAHNGPAFTIVGTVILALIAAGIFAPPRLRKGVIVAAIVAAAFIWIVGQAAGAVFGGESTDPNSGPLLALIALGYWPLSRGTVEQESDPRTISKSSPMSEASA